MYANLVAPARAQLDEKERACRTPLEHAYAREGCLPLPRPAYAHAARVVAVAADGLLDGGQALRKFPAHLGEVALAHGVAGHERVKRRLVLLGEREEHNARGIDIQALHRLGDGSHTLAHKRDAHAVCERRCARAVPVDEDSRELLCSKADGVLVNDGGRRDVRQCGGNRGARKGNGHPIARQKPRRRREHLSVTRKLAALERAGSGATRHARAQGHIKRRAGLGHAELKPRGIVLLAEKLATHELPPTSPRQSATHAKRRRGSPALHSTSKTVTTPASSSKR